MAEPRSYIVRIYRQGYRTLAGTVEDATTQGQRPFRDAEELAALLRASIPRRSNSDDDRYPTSDHKEIP